uniref:Uncharacterized protein n=1 Tax=Oryza glumipatula TaxID=40148 RepID=A0A0E0ARL4_9ORYZ
MSTGEGLGCRRNIVHFWASFAGFGKEVDGRRGGGSPAAQLSVAREWQRVEGAGGGVKWKSCGGRT